MELFVLEVSNDKGETWMPFTNGDPCISTTKAFVQSQVDFRYSLVESAEKIGVKATAMWRVGTYVRKDE